MKGNRWDDHYTRRARNEKWLARSVYKLEEIDKRFHLLKRSMRVLDLGCYPGSWSQYAIKRVGPRGAVFGIDLSRPEGIKSPVFRFLMMDVLNGDIEWPELDSGLLDLVLSDMAPPTTGIRTTDECRSLELAARALELSAYRLKRGGNFICKVFEGEDINAFKAKVSACFRNSRLVRPKATRKRSREVYVLGLGFVAADEQ